MRMSLYTILFKKTKLLFLVLFFSGMLPAHLVAQSALDPCIDQFIGSAVENAPTLFYSSPDEPFDTNQHLCYRTEAQSFFAMEYWPEQYAPRWVAYKISPEQFGEGACNTFTRNTAGCYFKTDTWDEFLACTDGDDPFHPDLIIKGNKLDEYAFQSTAHDRGHMAPGQSFSWNVCGWYHTFTMANMSPQRGLLNQRIWADLEQQVLTWAVDEGPLYVMTGTLFSDFPYDKFQVYRDSVLHSEQIYPRVNTFEQIVRRADANYETTMSGDILRPSRNPNPEQMKDQVRNTRIPTGYYTVIYIPATEHEGPRTIGFLIPHSFESLNMLADHYEGLSRSKAFWAFAARIDLIEEAGGVQFPGIPDELKQWGSDWFFSHQTSRQIRSNTCGMGTPQGIVENSTQEERFEACKLLMNEE